MKTMRIINSITCFEYRTQFDSLGTCLVRNEFLFDGAKYTNEHQGQHSALANLYVISQEMDISFRLRSYEEKEIVFNNDNFSEEELISFSGVFDFNIIQNPYFPEKKQGSLISIDKNYTFFNSIIKERKGQYFLLIYASKRDQPARCAAEDFYGDNLYYVHGIWEVELSDELRKIIFEK